MKTLIWSIFGLLCSVDALLKANVRNHVKVDAHPDAYSYYQDDVVLDGYPSFVEQVKDDKKTKKKSVIGATASTVASGAATGYRGFQKGYERSANFTHENRQGVGNMATSFTPDACVVKVLFLGYEEDGDDDYPYIPPCLAKGELI
eukprot:GDKJ01019756.1.p1 GENE.GDKJ01019756.1~~GDKJ01019756.1.p1  ORF type:complete len:146 (+),score=22.93 GDKJ01019756.1:24-461(+)